MEENTVKPVIKEFQDEHALIEAVDRLISQGIPQEDLFVVSNSDAQTDIVADDVDADEIEYKKMSIKIDAENMLNKQDDELQVILKELGLSQEESADFEDKLDIGIILLIIKNN